MPSKYDRYWLKKLTDISKLIEEAYIYGTSMLDVSDIRRYGDRQNWYGVVEVSDKINRGEMAHARSLGRIILENGLVNPYNCAFRFVISSNLKLRVVRLGTEEMSSQTVECIKHTSMASKIEESIEERKKNLTKILSEIPLEVWNNIVREEPEWSYMHRFLKKYGFGRFVVLMIAAGLNDFQFKGKAGIAYWPKLRDLLEKKAPDSLKEMEEMLAEFYARERLSDLKLKRLNHFLSSELADKLWIAEPEDIVENFIRIWYELAATMNQSRDAKTIAFAMKCTGISLLMAGKSNFSFEKIPIPVDYRVREFTKRLRVPVRDDRDVRAFWSQVLEGIKRGVNINMIHLDSLIWQIGVLRKHEIVEYFSSFGLSELGEKIAEMVE
jgi:DNA-(apurinic or apyrimidinic site) lyase